MLGLPTSTVSVRPVVLGEPDSHGNRTRTLGDPVTLEGVVRAPAQPIETGIEGDFHGREVDETWYLLPGDLSCLTEGAEATMDDGSAWTVTGPPVVYPISPVPWTAYVGVRHRV